jgi:DNA-binding NarL/FixJ family response regulator
LRRYWRWSRSPLLTSSSWIWRETLLLTARERDVLVLIDAGLSNKEIAVRLNIEVSTVKNHVHNVLEKLHVTSRAQAAAQLGTRVAVAGRGEQVTARYLPSI